MKTEKVSVNLSPVELGQIDYLVERGLYDSRSDFMRSAARKVLEGHADNIKEFLDTDGSKDGQVKFSFTMGIGALTKSEVEHAIVANTKIKIRVIGLYTIPNSITPEEIRKAVVSCKVYGKLIASKEVKAVLDELAGEER
ncbi:MAG: CopG family transcriptional regulator [Firmicutes bacterium]|nr:CopG family transcriptional regulator [Bacillota bacterium]